MAKEYFQLIKLFDVMYDLNPSMAFQEPLLNRKENSDSNGVFRLAVSQSRT